LGLDIRFYDPLFPPPDDVKQYLDGLGAATQSYLCANRDYILGAAGLGSAASGPVGAYSGLYGITVGLMNCPTPPPPPGGPGQPYGGITGGQCVATYRVNGFARWQDRYSPQGAQTPIVNRAVLGPLTGFQSCRPNGPNATLCDAGYRDRNGNTPLTVQYYSNVREIIDGKEKNTPGSGWVQITSISREGGGSDDCGTAKPIGGGGNGRVIPPQTPPVIYYAPVTINNLVVNVPITIGPIIVKPEFGPFNLSIGINGAQVPISLDGTVNLNSNNNTSNYSTSYYTEPPTSTDEKEEEKKANESLNDEATYRLKAFDCQEEEIEDIVRTASPLGAILSAIQDINLLDQKRFYLQCKSEIDPLPPFSLGSFTAQETEQIYEINNINNRALGLQIVCTQQSANVRPYAYSLSSGLAQARWGVAAVGTKIGGRTTYLPGEPLYYPDDFVTLPDLEVTSYSIRLTGVPGCSYTIYDCGLRR